VFWISQKSNDLISSAVVVVVVVAFVTTGKILLSSSDSFPFPLTSLLSLVVAEVVRKPDDSMMHTAYTVHQTSSCWTRMNDDGVVATGSRLVATEVEWMNRTSTVLCTRSSSIRSKGRKIPTRKRGKNWEHACALHYLHVLYKLTRARHFYMCSVKLYRERQQYDIIYITDAQRYRYW
jgi:hypothetical protein